MGLEEGDMFVLGKESTVVGVAPITAHFQEESLRILVANSDQEGYKIYLLDPNDDMVGVISYRFYHTSGDISHEKLCYINFFGTQNGKMEKGNFQELSALSDKKIKIRGLSYKIMEKFIRELCLPGDIKKIYLDADSPTKKGFWKDKMGKYLLGQGLIKQIYSQGMEICFVL